LLKPIPQFELLENFAAEASQLFVILSDSERWPADSIARVLVVREPGYVQVAFHDRSRASIQVTSQGFGKCEVRVSHELLPNTEAAKEHKKAWRQMFTRLRGQVER
jgi:hypothetical protein